MPASGAGLVPADVVRRDDPGGPVAELLDDAEGGVGGDGGQGLRPGRVLEVLVLTHYQAHPTPGPAEDSHAAAWQHRFAFCPTRTGTGRSGEPWPPELRAIVDAPASRIRSFRASRD